MEDPYWLESTTMVHSAAHSDGQCFISPVVVHQITHYTQDLHHNIPCDWVIHNSPSGYMDHDGWHKSMSHFKFMCCSSPLNHKVLFYGVDDSHFGDRELDIIHIHNIQFFIFKAGDYVNDHPTIIVQTWSSIIIMVMKEWTGWDTMEPSSLHRPTWIISLLKHGKIYNYHLRKSTRNISMGHISPLLPTRYWHQPPSLSCWYSIVKQIESGWYWTYSKGQYCAYTYGISQENWPNGHPEREGKV